MHIRNLAVATLLVVVSSALAQTTAPAAGPTTAPAAGPTTAPTTRPFTLGRDTTYITAPLLPDGRPDYIGYINAKASAGVTADNNAAIPLLELGGHKYLSETQQAAYAEQLGVHWPIDDLGFQDYRPARTDAEAEADWTPYQEAMRRPWTADEYPEVDQWLRANRDALDAVVAATNRPRFYVPLLRQSASSGGVFVISPFSHYRAMTKALIIRAYGYAGAGEMDKACSDLLAAQRLGRLVGQDPTLLGKLVAMAIVQLTYGPIGDLAAAGRFSPAQAEQLQDQLQSFTIDARDAATTTERFFFLDMVTWLAIHNDNDTLSKFAQAGVLAENIVRAVQDKQGAASMPADSAIQALSAACQTMGRDAMLRRINDLYDELGQIFQQPTHERRLEAAAKLNARIREMKERAGDRDAGDAFIGSLIPTFGNAANMADDVTSARNVAVAALALSRFKADTGKYPQSLGELAPKYVPAVPEDVMTGKPLIYKRQGEGYIVYSVGRNQRDDGGKTFRDGQGFDDHAARTPDFTQTSQPASRPAGAP